MKTTQAEQLQDILSLYSNPPVHVESGTLTTSTSLAPSDCEERGGKRADSSVPTNVKEASSSPHRDCHIWVTEPIWLVYQSFLVLSCPVQPTPFVLLFAPELASNCGIGRILSLTKNSGKHSIMSEFSSMYIFRLTPSGPVQDAS